MWQDSFETSIAGPPLPPNKASSSGKPAWPQWGSGHGVGSAPTPSLPLAFSRPSPGNEVRGKPIRHIGTADRKIIKLNGFYNRGVDFMKCPNHWIIPWFTDYINIKSPLNRSFIRPIIPYRCRIIYLLPITKLCTCSIVSSCLLWLRAFPIIKNTIAKPRFQIELMVLKFVSKLFCCLKWIILPDGIEPRYCI